MPQPFTTDTSAPGTANSPGLTITVGELSFTEDALFNIPSGTPPTPDYMIVNHYERDGRKYVMPVCSPQGFQRKSVAICQLANPTLLLISDWTVAQFGTKPIAPNPESQDPNWELLDVWPETAMETVGPDGVTPLWRLSGTFVYANTNPSENVFSDIVFPRPPWLKDNQPRNFPLTNLQNGLIDGTGTGGGSQPGEPAIPPGGSFPGITIR